MKEKSNTMDLILNAACQCVSDKGYANSSLRTIANEAGVQLSQLHYYFGSKQDLFKEVILRMKEDFLKEFSRRLHSLGGDENKYFQNISEFVQETIRMNPDLFPLLFDLASLSLKNDDFKRLITDLFDELAQIIESTFSERKQIVERISGQSLKGFSKIILSTVIGVAFQYSLDPERSQSITDSIVLLDKIS